MVTSNHFIIVMLQIIKTYQTKIKKRDLAFVIPNLALSYYLTILLSYQRQSLVILKPNFKMSLIVSIDVSIAFEYLHDNIGDLVPQIHAVEFFVAEAWYQFKTFHCVPLCS